MLHLFDQTRKTLAVITLPILVTFFLVSCSEKKEDVQPQPTIASLSVGEGEVGTNVTITGTNFGTIAADVEVRFNNTVAVINTVSATQITTSVPAGATSGTVKVKVKLLEATGSIFTVLAPVAVTVSPFNATLAENPSLGAVIGTITASTNRGTLSYSLTSQTPTGAMAINTSSGQLTVANAGLFNFEVNPTISGVVSVANGSEVKTASITITITDVAEPTVTVSNFTASIAENAAAASVLGTLTATATLGTATFSISSQTPAGAIAVNATTGQLTVADASKFNFELFPTITANVLATNSSATATATVTITLTDVTETVQKRLDDGETPLQIYNSNNALLNEIYGKTYRGGLIATFNTANGTGVIMTAAAIAGGPFTYLNAVSAANNLVLNTFEDWRLPTETEVNSICGILASVPNLWQPFGVAYWGQTTCCGGGGANNYSFGNGGCSGGFSPISILSEARAVRNY